MKKYNLVKFFYIIMAFIVFSINAKAQDYHFLPMDKTFDTIASKLCRMDFDNRRMDIDKKTWTSYIVLLNSKTTNS